MSGSGSGSDDGGAMGTVETVAVELSRLVAPIGHAGEALGNGRIEPLFALLNEMGVAEELDDDRYGEVQSVVETLGGPWTTVKKNVVTPIRNDRIPNKKGIEATVEALTKLFDNLNDLQGMSLPDAEAGVGLADLVVDYLIAEYLRSHHRHVYGLLCLTDVIVNERSGEPTEVDLSRVPELVREPGTIPSEVLDWGKPGFKAYVVVYYLSLLVSEFVPEASVEGADVFRAGVDSDDPNLGTQLNAPFLSTRVGNVDLVLGSKLVPVPAHGNKRPGLGLYPYAAGKFDETWELGGGWEFRSEVGAEIADWMLAVQPTKSGGTDAGIRVLDGETPVTVEDLLPPDDPKVSTVGLPDLHAEAELAYTGGESGRTAVVGSEEGGGLYLRDVSVRGILDAADDGPSFAAELPTTSELEVNPEGGFVSKVLPDEFSSTFEVTGGYAASRGIYVDAGATLRFPIPVNESIGPITLKEIYIELGFTTDPGEDEPPVTVVGAASASVKLGPIVGTVDRIGVEAGVRFPEDNDGNFGPLQVDLGFKPPRGAGLSIAAGSAVKGGGYLFHDDEKERYGGTAQLKLPGGLKLSAVGLITTQLPDGSDGFSLFVMIAGEFTPIPIGGGFTLEGVGGMLGINRRFRGKALRKVVRKGNLQSVLFPENVVENAQRIISDVRRIFPPERGTHVFGPMVKVGFGKPKTMAFSLGIVLEVPTFRVAILGRMELGLPGLELPAPEGLPEEVPWPQVKVNLDVAGVLDLPGKFLKIDGTIYDSHVLLWSLKGDLAVRARWGETSQFLISLGGFHPAYESPKNVPDLQRLTLALDLPGSTPTVTFKGYMAVTSNSFQVGANLHAELDQGQVFISGTLGFDALFQFKPFEFRFSFLVNFKIEIAGFELGAGIEGRITGPSPMRIRGTGHVNPPGMPKVSANFDLKLGKETGSSQLPGASVVPPLVDALEAEKNWNAALPAGGEGAVSLRGAGKRATEAAESGGGGGGGEPRPVRAHPLGTLTVTQGVVPLSYTIEKFGESKPATYNRFGIDSVTVGSGGAERTSPESGEFAPAKYKSMDTREKLESPDFVDREAGRTVGSSETFVGGETTAENATHARFRYEEQVHDRERDRRGDDVADAHAGATHTAHVAKRQVADRASSQTDTKGRFQVREDPEPEGPFSVGERGFVVVDESTFERVDTGLVTGGSATGSGEAAGGEKAGDGERPTATGTLAGTGDPDRSPGLSRGAAEDARRQIAAVEGRPESDLSVVAVEEWTAGTEGSR